LEKCRQCIREGSADEAHRQASDALAIFEERGDSIGQADAARAVVNAMVGLGQVQEAAEFAKERLSGIRKSGERSLPILRRREAPLMLATAEVQLEANEPEKAIASAAQARGFFQGVNDWHGAAEAQLVPAKVHLRQGSSKEAIAAAQAAAESFRRLGDRPGEAVALELAVEAHFGAADYARAVEAAETAQAVFDGIGDRAGVGRMLQWAARANLERGRPEDALDAARGAMRSFTEAGRRRDCGHSMMWAARAHISQQEHNHALIMAKEALSTFAQIGERKCQADAESEISQMLMQTGKLEEATSHAEVAHRLYKELQDNKGKKEANEMLCTLELAPDAIELRQAKIRSLTRKLVRAVSSRDPQAFKEALRDLGRAEYKGMFAVADIKAALDPLMTDDPGGTTRFVRANAGSWSELASIEAPKSAGLKDWTMRFFEEK